MATPTGVAADDNALLRAEVEQSRELSMKEFLETIHPSISKSISDLWTIHQPAKGVPSKRLNFPALRLHCSVCDGERTFRCFTPIDVSVQSESANLYPTYRCGDCQQQIKTYSLSIRFGEGSLFAQKKWHEGEAFKYGERPPYGSPVPAKLLRLFGKDGPVFLKGRQCENQGLGVGAFAYYRRVVENHKNDIIDELIRVCETVDAPQQLTSELIAARKEVSFSKAIDLVKTGLPQGLLINGQNPLTALHRALSVGLHDESDDECLAAAHAVRLVLGALIERMSLLRQDDKKLQDAVQLLLQKKGPKD
jgi:hypothetical protein